MEKNGSHVVYTPPLSFFVKMTSERASDLFVGSDAAPISCRRKGETHLRKEKTEFLQRFINEPARRVMVVTVRTEECFELAAHGSGTARTE